MALFKRRKRAVESVELSASPAVPEDPLAVDRDLVVPDTKAAKTTIIADPNPESSPEPDDSPLSGIGGVEFVKEAAASFSPPEFTAYIPKLTPNVDVTPQAEAPDPSPAPESEIRPVAAAPYIPPAPQPKPEPEDVPETRENRLNLGTLREDMARITADIYTDIEQGDTLYRRAQKRVEGLMSFVEKAELDYTAINRLEPENRRLKAKNIDLTRDLESQGDLLKTLQNNMTNQRRQLVDTQELLDDSRRKLASSMTAVKRRDDDLRKALRAIDQLTTKVERQSISTNVESSENTTLRQKLKNLSAELTRLNQEKIMQAKMIDSLRNDYDSLRTNRGTSETTMDHLKVALAASKKRNSELLSHLESLQSDIAAFKTQYEFNLSNRDRRIIQLESEVEKLERQVSIKEEVISESAKSVTDMRDRKDNQELDYIRLEKIIADQTEKMSEMRHALADSQQKNAGYERELNSASDSTERDEIKRLAGIIDLQQKKLEEAAERETYLAPDPGTTNMMDTHDLARLEQIIADQQRELTEAKAKLAETQSVAKERDQRYDEVARALEESQSRLDANVQSDNPDISPAGYVDENTVKLSADDNAFDQAETKGMSEDSIDDLILDYKLGLRDKIG